jgi:hypothetical protein
VGEGAHRDARSSVVCERSVSLRILVRVGAADCVSQAVGLREAKAVTLRGPALAWRASGASTDLETWSTA